MLVCLFPPSMPDFSLSHHPALQRHPEKMYVLDGKSAERFSHPAIRFKLQTLLGSDSKNTMFNALKGENFKSVSGAMWGDNNNIAPVRLGVSQSHSLATYHGYFADYIVRCWTAILGRRHVAIAGKYIPARHQRVTPRSNSSLLESLHYSPPAHACI